MSHNYIDDPMCLDEKFTCKICGCEISRHNRFWVYDNTFCSTDHVNAFRQTLPRQKDAETTRRPQMSHGSLAY
jgi:hypothetical protein